MSTFLKKIYFFAKLSTSLLLLIIVFLLIFLFSKSYLKQEDSLRDSLKTAIDEINLNVKNISQENKLLLNNLDNKIKNIEAELIDIRENNSQNINTELKRDLANLSREINILKQESRKIQNQNISINRSTDRDTLINDYLNGLHISIEKGINFKEIIVEMSKLSTNTKSSQYLEKLLLLSEGRIISLNKLNEMYNNTEDAFLKSYLLEKSNGSIFTKYFLDFFSLKSDYNLSSNDQVINSLSLAKNYLSNKEVGSAIDELKKIQNTTDLFNDWIEHALVYNESIQLVLEMKEELLIK